MGMVNIWKNQGLEQGIEQGIEQGLEKGLEQGEQIGKKKECIALLTRQLRRKFGLQPELEAALQQMPEMELERLEDLADALLDFKAISDLQAWLNSDNPHQPI
jgi:flagellar biosynthesis/type III secretory pathway protein FliH